MKVLETPREVTVSHRRVEGFIKNLPQLDRIETPMSVRDAKWFRDAGLAKIVNPYALRLDRIDKFSGKVMPAKANCDALLESGKLEGRPTLIVPSSGNFAKDVAALRHGYPIHEVWGVLNNNTPNGKISQLEAAGAVPIIAPKNFSAIEWAYKIAGDHKNAVVMNQYIEEASITGHLPTMEQIAAGMWAVCNGGFDLGAVAGSCSTLQAARRYLPKLSSGPVKIFGVASKSKAEKVPGSRAPEDLEELRDIDGIRGFMFREEWSRKGEEVLDFDLVTDVTRDEAYAMNGELFGYHYSVGPTGALLTAGFYSLLRRCCERGELERLMNKYGQINVVLIWVDSYYAYDDADYRRFLIG